METRPPGAGKSSFDLVDTEKLFANLRLSRGSVIVDLGCGTGNYTVALASAVGGEGVLHGVDLWEEGLSVLRERAAAGSFQNIRTITADITERLPLDDHTVDVCFMATVLHDLASIDRASGAIDEARRLLRPDGMLAVVEYKKFDGRPGPSINIKLAPGQAEQIVAVRGFRKRLFAELGPYHYLMVFEKNASFSG